MTTTVHPETESEKLILQPIPLHAPKAGARISAEEFAALSPVDRVKAAYDIHGDKVVQLASMQKTAGVIMHLIYRANVKIPILFFDTGYLHQETKDMRDIFMDKYGLEITTVKPELTVEQQDRLHGKDLWRTKAGQLQCCYMRKEQPLLKALSEMKVEATIAGLMRTEGGARKGIKAVDDDPRTHNRLYHPLFDFTNKDIHDYTNKYDLPVHALYAKNYLSIGCAPCTTPVLPGEDARAGRWRHLRKEGETHAYCGMNYTDVERKEPGTPPNGKKALFKRKPTNTSQESPSSSLSAVRKSFRGEAGQAGDGGKKVNGFSTSDK